MKKKCLNLVSEINSWRKRVVQTCNLLTASILFMCFFTLSPTLLVAQNKQNIKVQDASLSEVFEQIRMNSDYQFIYNASTIKHVKNLTVDMQDVSIETILDSCLANTDLKYRIKNNTIIIDQKTENNDATKQNQKKKVSGKVVDAESGQPLVGVNVYSKNMGFGTTTDADGKYSLLISESTTHLFFSFIGFKNQEIVIGDQEEINIHLQPEATGLMEVVATGMRQRVKATMIGSTSTVNTEAIESRGVTTIDNAIKGLMPGVYITNSGRPGAIGEIQIRGINTMTGNTNPLYVLDGMPMQEGEISGGVSQVMTKGIGNIPPEDIQSITILKDATAASVYGSRAANGVVVITTKVGQIGKDYLNYTGKYGVTFRPEVKWDFMNSNQKVDFEQQIYDDFNPTYGGRVIQILNEYNNGLISPSERDTQINMLKNTNTDWIDEIYRVAHTQSHMVTMSGGTHKLQYHASLNYQNSEGILKGNTFQKGGMNLKLSRYINDDLLIRFNLYTTLKENIEPNSSIDPYQYAVFANPYEKPYNNDGSFAVDRSYLNLTSNILYLNDDFIYDQFNIFREMQGNTLTNTYANIRGQLAVECKFLDDFRYTGQAVYEYTSTHDIDESLEETYRSWVSNWLNRASEFGKIDSKFNRGFLSEYMGRNTSYTIRNTLEYNKKFDVNFLQLFVANEFGQTTNHRFNHMNPIYDDRFRITGYPLWQDISKEDYDRLRLDDFGGTYFAQDRSVSFIGSAVYSYNDKYVANFNIRYDGVDILGSDNQFSPLWSAGIKWNAHNEKFIKNNENISRLALSVGYGFRGSINRSVLPFHTYKVSTIQYGGYTTADKFNYGNPVLKWEKKEEVNLGLEASFLKGRINFEARYFDEKITDLLDQLSLSPSVGRTSASVNVGSLSNKGYELSVQFQPVKTDDWLFEVSGNITKVENKLEDVFKAEIPRSGFEATSNIEGYPIDSWFGYKFSHVNPETGGAMVYAQKETISTVGGDVVSTFTDELIDLSTITSQTLATEYRTYHLGQKNPDVYGGFNFLLRYKSLDLSAYFVGALGNELIKFNDRNQGPNYRSDDITASRTNRLVDNLNRWRHFGDITNIPAYSRNTTNYHYYLVDSDIEDGSYLKLSNISLGWRVPASVLKNSFIKTLKANLIASNLFTWTNYSGADPELLNNPFGYPNSKSITLSVNVGF